MNESKISTGSYRNLPRRRFSQEFKRRVVAQLSDAGSTVAQVAREHGLHPNQLCRWRNEYRNEVVQQYARATMLPVTLVSVPESMQESGAASNIGLRISLARGQVYVVNGCTPELVRVAIEALQ